jgi:hypothetical protein
MPSHAGKRCAQDAVPLAEVPDEDAHRYQHTFAVELLLAGMPMERVSILLATLQYELTKKLRGMESGTPEAGGTGRNPCLGCKCNRHAYGARK